MAMESGTAENGDEGLEGVMGILSQQLENVATIKTRDAAITTALVNDNNTVQKTNDSLDSEYLKLISPDEQVRAWLPKGTRITTMTGNIRTVVDPATQQTMVLKKKDEYIEAVTNATHNDVQATTRAYEQASAVIKPFDLGVAMRTLRDKRGEELLNQIDLVNANIDSEVARERDAIRQQAAIKSGLVEAEANYNTNIMLDRQKGGMFLNQASAQTENAMQVRDRAQLAAQRYEQSLVESSQRMRELSGAKETLNRRMTWRGQQDVLETNRDENRERQNEVIAEQRRRDAEARGERDLARFERNRQEARDKFDYETAAKREIDLEKRIGAGGPADRMNTLIAERAQVRAEKQAILRSTVTESNLANYHYVYGTSGNDDQDRITIIAKRDRDKTMQMVLSADTTTMYDMLSSDDQSVRQKGYALINGSDKALNDPATKGMDSKTLTAYIQNTPISPIVGKIQQVFSASFGTFADLKKIAQKTGIDRNMLEELSNADLRAGAKDKETNKRMLTQKIIATVVNAHMRGNITDNVLNWKTSETSEDSALGKVMRSIPPTDGKVSMDTFIQTVMNTEIKDPADPNKLMTTGEKTLLLKRAVEVAAKNTYRSMLFPANDALAMELMAKVEQNAFLRSIQKTLGINLEAPAWNNLSIGRAFGAQ